MSDSDLRLGADGRDTLFGGRATPAHDGPGGYFDGADVIINIHPFIMPAILAKVAPQRAETHGWNALLRHWYANIGCGVHGIDEGCLARDVMH